MSKDPLGSVDVMIWHGVELGKMIMRLRLNRDSEVRDENVALRKNETKITLAKVSLELLLLEKDLSTYVRYAEYLFYSRCPGKCRKQSSQPCQSLEPDIISRLQST